MANLKKRFQEILEDLEKNIKNKEDLEYIKSQVYNISLLFLDEIDKIAELNLDRINVMLEREKELGYKISDMEKIIRNIEKEVFVSPECDVEIICPYCNTEFVQDLARGVDNEVRCPECGNLIELDWNEDDECGHHQCDCDSCHSHDCDHEEEDENEEEYDEEYDENEQDEDEEYEDGEDDM